MKQTLERDVGSGGRAEAPWARAPGSPAGRAGERVLGEEDRAAPPPPSGKVPPALTAAGCGRRVAPWPSGGRSALPRFPGLGFPCSALPHPASGPVRISGFAIELPLGVGVRVSETKKSWWTLRRLAGPRGPVCLSKTPGLRGLVRRLPGPAPLVNKQSALWVSDPPFSVTPLGR